MSKRSLSPAQIEKQRKYSRDYYHRMMEKKRELQAAAGIKPSTDRLAAARAAKAAKRQARLAEAAQARRPPFRPSAAAIASLAAPVKNAALVKARAVLAEKRAANKAPASKRLAFMIPRLVDLTLALRAAGCKKAICTFADGSQIVLR